VTFSHKIAADPFFGILPRCAPAVAVPRGVRTWLASALATECAWQSWAVPAHEVPGQDQHFLDLLPCWASAYHWESRSSAPGSQPKVLPRLFGAYSCTRYSEATGRHLARPDGPLLQLSHAGLTLAGQPIPASWSSPWTIEWRAVPLARAPTAWASGAVTFSPDRHTAHGRVCGELRCPETWTLTRSRVVGGPGAVSIFSMKRRSKACPIAARSLPFAPTNRQSYSRPLASTITPVRPPTKVANSWHEVFRTGRYATVLVCPRILPFTSLPRLSTTYVGGPRSV